jgi:hypothetical protein
MARTLFVDGFNSSHADRNSKKKNSFSQGNLFRFGLARLVATPDIRISGDIRNLPTIGYLRAFGCRKMGEGIKCAKYIQHGYSSLETDSSQITQIKERSSSYLWKTVFFGKLDATKRALTLRAPMVPSA